jgi:uncharacterized protein YjbJ (UPF0337 family)
VNPLRQWSTATDLPSCRQWGNLTDDDLTAINGQRDQLEGKIQERYGLAKDQVRKDVDDWYNAQTW